MGPPVKGTFVSRRIPVLKGPAKGRTPFPAMMEIHALKTSVNLRLDVSQKPFQAPVMMEMPVRRMMLVPMCSARARKWPIADV